MRIERGIKRILVALSGLVLIGWGGVSLRVASEGRWAYVAHHTTVEAWCDPARRSIYDVQQPADDAKQVAGWWIPGCQVVDRGVILDVPPKPLAPSSSLADLGAEPYPPKKIRPARRAPRDDIDAILDEPGHFTRVPTVVIRHTEFRWVREYALPVAGLALALTLGSLGLLWGAFYTLRWIGRGFAKEITPEAPK